LDLHDLMPEFLEGRSGRGAGTPLGRLIRWQERVSCRFADHVLTVSDPWRETLISRGVPPERCSVVMNVADRAVFSSASIRPRTADDPFHLLYHGYITRRYGIDVALRAVARIRDEIPRLRFTVVGGGEHLDDMRRLSTELALDDIVTFLPARPPAELPDIIASADLGIVAYRDDVFTDSLVPTKLMEFAEMGVACVASRTTAIERYFTDTMVDFCRPGDVDDLARVVLELWRDPGRRAVLAARGERFTSRYNWTEVGAAYVRLVASLGGVDVSTTRSREWARA
jgi:glycosyltransferase involved in cell wall biosynthesis